jgi:cytochrome P450
LDLPPEHGPSIELDTYADAREAFFNKDLSRTFDRRSFENGNIREGVVSTAHGALHRARRRVENTQFRADVLRADEFELYPRMVNDLLNLLIDQVHVDLFRIADRMCAVLAATRVGIDVDWRSLDQISRLDSEVDGLVQMSAILDSKDPERSRQIARQALIDWERDFVAPSWQRRIRLIEIHGHDSDDLPNDLLTVLLLNRNDKSLELEDDARIVRELASYMTGGTQANSVALVNVIDLLLPLAEADHSIFDRIIQDRAFAQRCVHESLRLRPNTPKPKRRAEAETHVGNIRIPQGAVVTINVALANVDERVFGPTAKEWDPDRVIPDGVPRWGLSFGAGPHQCPGRSVAAGFPRSDDAVVDDDHLVGLVAIMLHEFVRRGVMRDPEHPPAREARTERFNAWLSYPVIVERHSNPVSIQ